MELRERKDMQHLIAVGKEKGFVTLDDVSRHLPSDFLSTERIDRVLALFGELEITVVEDDDADVEAPADVAADAVDVVVDEVDDTPESAEVEALPASADPVRRYLHD